VVNAASDKAPAGARGHRVMLTARRREGAAFAAGDGRDYRPGWDGHDARRKIGLLTEADLVDRAWWCGLPLRAGLSRGGRAIHAQSPEAMA